MNVFNLIAKFGISEYKIVSNGTEIKAKCPFHDDHNPSFYIQISTGLYFCHACHAKGIITNDGVQEDYDYEYLYQQLNKKDKKEEIIHKYTYIPLSSEGRAYLHSRKILDQTIEKFGICEILEPRFFKRIIVPVTDQFFIARTYIDAKPKFLYPYGAKHSNYVFECLHTENEVMIVEGIFDALYLWQNGYSASSILGCYLSAKQKSIITKYKKIILMFDGDVAGLEGLKYALKALAGYNVFYVIINSDPDEITDFSQLKIKKYNGVFRYDLQF